MSEDKEFHPASMIFPMMAEDEIDGLVEDIRANGLLEPIVLHEGKVLDGRNRQSACRLAGRPATYTEFTGDDPVSFVLSRNLHRRHLTAGQRAAVAVKADEMWKALKAAAKSRMSAGGGDKKSEKSGKASSPYPIPDRGASSDKAGEAVGVSGRSVRRAQRVQREGAPEVFAALESGEIGINRAEQIATMYPKSEQPKILKDGTGVESNEPQETNGKSLGKGVRLAHEAVNCLKQIPKNDPLRNRGFQIVTDWIRHNK